MRMWMVDPKRMCRKHLLGEHFELHMFCGSIRKKRSFHGYVLNNLLEIQTIEDRHNLIVKEMKVRKYNHVTPIELPDVEYLDSKDRNYTINRKESFLELLRRCDLCRSL